MKFAYVIYQEVPVVIGQAEDNEWRVLDIANDILHVIDADWLEVEASQKRGQAVQESDLYFLAPITRPNKIIAIGRNYHEHAAEQNVKPPDKPLIFAKFPSSITGPNSVIQWD